LHRRPRVLFIGNYLPGVASFSLELSRCLELEGYRIIRASACINRPLRLADMVLTAIENTGDYDVAHIDVFSGRAFLFAECLSLLLSALGKPIALTLHGGDLPRFARRHPARVRRLLAGAALVTAPSSYLREELHSFRSDIHLIPNAVHLAHFTPRPLRAPARIIWLRAFHTIYNPFLAPVVLSRLGSQFSGIQLLMYGPDKGDGSLALTQEAARRLGVAHRIHFCGPIAHDQVPQTLSQADIFLNTTDVDNTPLTLIEAMACGLCVVSTNVGGVPHLLRHEHDALLAPSRDASALAAAVRRLLTDTALSARLSVNARETAARFDWSAVLPLWHRTFDAITAGARAETMDSLHPACR